MRRSNPVSSAFRLEQAATASFMWTRIIIIIIVKKNLPSALGPVSISHLTLLHCSALINVYVYTNQVTNPYDYYNNNSPSREKKFKPGDSAGWFPSRWVVSGRSRAMATVNSIPSHQRLILPLLPRWPAALGPRALLPPTLQGSTRRRRRSGWSSRSVSVSVTSDELDVIPVQSLDSVDQQDGKALAVRSKREEDEASSGNSQVGGFAFEAGGMGDVGGGGSGSETGGFPSSPSALSSVEGGEDSNAQVDRAINAMIVLAAGTFAITKLLTIDRDYWHGWTIYEILRYAPQHNWVAYEEALKTNPVLAKMAISGVVYSLGDWIAQCYEGKPLFDFDRTRMFRSGLVGFTLHGSLSHYYYYFCEALFPFQDWWVVPAKVVFDQTAWSGVWNSIYFVVLGFLRFESPANIASELRATFWPMLTAGWKLWPFAHLITYGVVPVEQRLLWVDCVELVWVTILSTYSNEKSEARHSEALESSNDNTAAPAKESSE